MAAMDGVSAPAMTTITLGRCVSRGERQGSKPTDTHDQRRRKIAKGHERRSTTMLETSRIRHEPQGNQAGLDRTAQRRAADDHQATTDLRLSFQRLTQAKDGGSLSRIHVKAEELP
jgi:hypothetical protein